MTNLSLSRHLSRHLSRLRRLRRRDALGVIQQTQNSVITITTASHSQGTFAKRVKGIGHKVAR